MAAVIAALALLPAGCGERAAQAPEATVQTGIDRSVADVRAAEAAMAGPALQSKSVAELTGKAATETGSDGEVAAKGSTGKSKAAG